MNRPFENGNWWAVSDVRVAVRIPTLALSDTLAKLQSDAYYVTAEMLRGHSDGLELVGDPNVVDVAFRAGRPAKKNIPKVPLIYVAHPFGSDRENLFVASTVVAILNRRYDAIFWAPWIPIAANWENERELNDRAMAICMSSVGISDGFLGFNLDTSPGGKQELARAQALQIPTVVSTVDIRTSNAFEPELDGMIFSTFGVRVSELESSNGL